MIKSSPFIAAALCFIFYFWFALMLCYGIYSTTEALNITSPLTLPPKKNPTKNITIALEEASGFLGFLTGT